MSNDQNPDERPVMTEEAIRELAEEFRVEGELGKIGHVSSQLLNLGFPEKFADFLVQRGFSEDIVQQLMQAMSEFFSTFSINFGQPSEADLQKQIELEEARNVDAPIGPRINIGDPNNPPNLPQ